ncbi:MAG: pyridoxal-phosphate dependent enzyme, partial [Aggregatilineales bacterium]
EKLASEGLVGLHPFDSDGQLAGVGTVGLEILEDVPQMTDVFISIGGGGLIGGTAVAMKAKKPDIRLWGVETEKANAMQAALDAGEVVNVKPTSLAKTLGAPFVSVDALALMQEYMEDLIIVSDEDAIVAQRVLLEDMKLFTELAASCVLSAVGQIQDKFTSDSHVVLLICGGNEDPVDMVNRW